MSVFFDQIGFTKLKSEFAAELPDGSNVELLQAEAYWAGTKDWAVDPLQPSASGKILDYRYATTGAITSYSYHANEVFNVFAGKDSMLPSVQKIYGLPLFAYEDNIISEAAYGTPVWTPFSGLAPWSVENHSYTENNNLGAMNINRLFDNYVIDNNVVVCWSLDNQQIALQRIYLQAYNLITVGNQTANCSIGETTFDVSGRIKPDIVGTDTYTSYCSPIVANSAALLVSKAKSDPTLEKATKAQVIKSLLCAGADKDVFSRAWANTPKQPIDFSFGAGRVNIYNSYVALRNKNFDFANIGANQKHQYNFSFTGNKKFCVSLNWFSSYDKTLFVRNTPVIYLRLLDFNGVLIESTSDIDNLQHIFAQNLSDGSYTLEVENLSSYATDYGIAWFEESTNVTPPEETWQSYTELVETTYTAWSPSEDLYYTDETVVQTRIKTQKWYTYEKSNLGNIRNEQYTYSTEEEGRSISGTKQPDDNMSDPINLTKLNGVTWSARGDNPSSVVGTSEGIAELFDGKTNTKWLDFSKNTWVIIDLVVAAVLSSYLMTSANDATQRDPGQWTVSGSNDGSTWEQIDARSNSGNTWTSRLQTITFAVNTSKAFRYYKFDIQCVSGDINQLAELSLWGTIATTTPPDPDPTPTPDPTGLTLENVLTEFETLRTNLNKAIDESENRIKLL